MKLVLAAFVFSALSAPSAFADLVGIADYKITSVHTFKADGTEIQGAGCVFEFTSASNITGQPGEVFQINADPKVGVELENGNVGALFKVGSYCIGCGGTPATIVKLQGEFVTNQKFQISELDTTANATVVVTISSSQSATGQDLLEIDSDFGTGAKNRCALTKVP